jgi:hypothetical protein
MHAAYDAASVSFDFSAFLPVCATEARRRWPFSRIRPYLGLDDSGRGRSSAYRSKHVEGRGDGSLARVCGRQHW